MNIKFASLPPVSKSFFLDHSSKIMALGGPVGTGKTFTQALRIFYKAVHIKPMDDGVRRSKFIIVRKRYGDLEESVVPTFEKICGAAFDMTGRKSPLHGKIYFEDDRGKVECDLWLYAFETVADAQKIRSLAFTDGAIIEAQEMVSATLIKEVYKRLGRFPAPENADELDDFETNPMLEYHFPDGAIATGKQLTLDFNYTNRTHWLKKYLVDDNRMRSDGTRIRTVYEQPATHIWVPGGTLSDEVKGVEGRYKGEEGIFARNPDALHYIKHNGWEYWEDILEESMGDDAAIQQDVLAKFGDNVDGKPVYPKFSREEHVAKRPLKFIPGLPVWVGVDNGFNNAWIFCQQDRSGMLMVIAEIINVGEDAKSIKSAIKDDIKPFTNNQLFAHDVKMVLDQAFWQRDAGDGERTQLSHIIEAGYDVVKCPYKFTSPIRDKTGNFIDTRSLLISPTCTKLIDALSGGFHYPINKQTGQISEEPNQKSEHSHPVNAFEFVCAKLSRHKPKKKGARKKREFSYV